MKRTGKFHALDLTGQRFGRLVAVERFTTEKLGQWWTLLCDCGKLTTASCSTLRSNHKKSCGCGEIDARGKARTTHGESHGENRSAEYKTWLGVKRRCFNQNEKNFKTYGGRGITMCCKWEDSYAQFLIDMGRKPTPRHTIERIDNDGDYCPENCRWATMQEQQSNRSDNHIITIGKKSMMLMDWSRKSGVHHALILARRNRLGWSWEDAILTPTGKNYRGQKPHERKTYPAYA